MLWHIMTLIRTCWSCLAESLPICPLMLWGQTPNPSMSRLLLAWSDSWCQSWSLSFHVLALSLHGSWFSRSSLRFKQKSVAVPQMNAGFNACYTSQLTAMKMPLNLIAPFLQQPVMYSSCRKKGVKASGITRAICLTNASSSRILSPGPMSPTAQSGRSFQDISPHPSVGEVSALPSAGQSPSASPDGLSAGWGGCGGPSTLSTIFSGPKEVRSLPKSSSGEHSCLPSLAENLMEEEATPSRPHQSFQTLDVVMVGLSGGHRAPSPLVPMRVFGGVGRMQVVPGPPQLTKGLGCYRAAGWQGGRWKGGHGSGGSLETSPRGARGEENQKKNTRLGKKPLSAPPKSPCRSEWKVRLEQKNGGKGH